MPAVRQSAGRSGNSDPAGEPSRDRADGALPDEALHTRTRRADPGARALAAQQAGEDRRRYVAAASTARAEKLIAGGRVVPARITIALDLRELHGPAVDEQVGTWHGNPDGDIDRWEQALAVPSREQAEQLAALTDFPLAWFYEPLRPGPFTDGPAWMCFSGRRGCELVQPNVITAEGVLLYEGQPREPVDTLPAPMPGMPAPETPAPRKRAPAARTTPRKKAPAAVQQPTLPNLMPERLRTELMAKLAARKKP